MDVIAVGAGGFVGAILRYLIGKLVVTPAGFPLGTLAINLLGCLFLAWFFTKTANKWKISPQLKLTIGTGFTGAFTTFSTFSVETLHLIENHQLLFAILYVLLSVIGGIVFAFVGSKLASFQVSAKGGEFNVVCRYGRSFWGHNKVFVSEMGYKKDFEFIVFLRNLDD